MRALKSDPRLDSRSVTVLPIGWGKDEIADLYAAHAPAAFRRAYLLTGDRDVAADVVQDAFVRVLARFRGLRDPEAFAAYLRRVVINLTNDRFRKLRSERIGAQRQRASARVDVATLPDVEARDAIGRALHALPSRQRAALVLRYYDDLSEEQTAEALGCSVRAVKALVTRGMTALRERLRSEGWT